MGQFTLLKRGGSMSSIASGIPKSSLPPCISPPSPSLHSPRTSQWYTTIKVIPTVVYNCGSNFTRINFEGFYTVVLEKDEEIISVASIRIHGTKLAEMPFIATSEAYRSKGMCRKLMAAIESALCFLNVENLIIPSVLERIENWTGRYGFRPLDLSMKKEIMLHNTLMFHDSVRLQKVLSSSSHLSYCTSHPS
ncbi:hypothetical protein ACS0TY_001497 [Phlomoides rotata]